MFSDIFFFYQGRLSYLALCLPVHFDAFIPDDRQDLPIQSAENYFWIAQCVSFQSLRDELVCF